MQSFELVEDDALLRGLVNEWRKLSEIAIDLEMEAHLHHYGLHLALVQVSDGKDIWLVDPLAIGDPSPLVSLFHDERVQKVFHDVSFDFRVLKSLWDCTPRNVFDTKIASLLLGKDSISLAGLLQEYYGVEKDEKFQKVDWLKRPLDKGMLAYAAGDVKLLLQLKRRLESEIKEKERWQWFKDETDYLERQSYIIPERTFQDVKGTRGLSDRERGVFKELFSVRNQMAEKLDKPIFFIIPDKVLVQLAKRPVTEQAIRSLGRVHPIVKRQAYRFVNAARKARPVPKEKKHHRRIRHKEQERIDAILQEREKLAGRLGIEAFLILTREQAEALVVDGEDALRPWQRTLLQEAKII